VLKTYETQRRRECLVCGHRFASVEILRDEHHLAAMLREALALAEHRAAATALVGLR
jgi:transcriptional regulator NrdR family protein